MGIFILTSFCSQGIGTEAVRQISRIAFRELSLESIIGEVFPINNEGVVLIWYDPFVNQDLSLQFRDYLFKMLFGAMKVSQGTA